MKHIIIAIFLITFCNLCIMTNAVAANCDEETCAVCCIYVTDASNNNVPSCITDILKCTATPTTNFNNLYYIIYVTIGFFIGLPLLIFIMDFLFTGRIFSYECKPSFCEIIAKYMCCWICVSFASKQNLNGGSGSEKYLQSKSSDRPVSPPGQSKTGYKVVPIVDKP